MNPPKIAYFSMEIALDPTIPTYCGGLGILAGDTLRSAADLGVPLCAISLVHRKGYFHQRLDRSGHQTEEPEPWDPASRLEEQSPRVTVAIEGRTVVLRAWKHEIVGVSGFVVPVFLLDACLPENGDYHRTLTDRLYGGDPYYRLCQELILGAGGVRMLRALGLDGIKRFHMNEGHAALLGLELLSESAAAAGREHVLREDVETVRRQCVFTTHTPVPAGHDRFPMPMVRQVLGEGRNFLDMEDLFCPDLVGHVLQREGWGDACADVFSSSNYLHMTYLALNVSHYVNGVAKRHAEVSKLMFAGYRIDAITNGVHAATWASPSFRDLFDRHIPGWKADNFSLRYALGTPDREIWQAHREAKHQLFEEIRRATGREFDVERFTIGFARRATRYKRAHLLLSDPGRLRSLAREFGPLQVVFAGKAHPGDTEGSAMIERIIRDGNALKPEIEFVYLENYAIAQAKLLTAGVDLWLNTPLPPQEASGTSGMKAALNGVPSLSILDGWWIEGCIEGVTGWAIGDGESSGTSDPGCDERDATALYDKLAVILEIFHRQRHAYLAIMRSAIALNGSFFNTQRMMQQYVVKAYFE